MKTKVFEQVIDIVVERDALDLKVKQLERQLADSVVFGKELRDIIHELDPHYFEKRAQRRMEENVNKKNALYERIRRHEESQSRGVGGASSDGEVQVGDAGGRGPGRHGPAGVDRSHGKS